MQIITSGIPFTFVYATFDENNSLFIQASIYDVTTGSAIFVQTVNMTDVVNGVYSGNYTGIGSKSYLVIMASFTDGSYSTLDTSRAPDAECYQEVSGPVTFFPFNYGAYDLDASLFIRGIVYDTTTGSAVFVSNINMTYVTNGVYFGSYTGITNHSYVVPKFVYTDGTYSVLDSTRAPGSDVFQGSTFSSGGTTNNFLVATLSGNLSPAILRANQ